MSTFEGIGGYPGRGVLVRRCSDGGFEWAYFVTGRSESSRSRRARRVGDVVSIEPTGPVPADPLRHYEGPLEEPVGSARLHLLSSDEPIDRLVGDLWSSLPTVLRVLLLVGTGSSVAGCRLVHQES